LQEKAPDELGGEARHASPDSEERHRRVDFLVADDPKAVEQAARDLADLASFAYTSSDDGRNPAKMMDAVRMLVILQEEELNAGGGVSGHIGLQNRFVERWGTVPECDPLGFLNTAHRLSLITRDLSVTLTTKGSRLLGALQRLLSDWYAFHTKSDIEQLLFQSEREVELMEAYEAKGYDTRALGRALSFLEKAYKDISDRTHEMIASGIAIDQVRTMLERYDFLLDAIAKQRDEGFEHSLPVLDRVENAKAAALEVAFDTMTGVLSHSTGKALSEMNPINKARFYGWLREAFGSGRLLELAAEAGDVTLPVYLAGHPSYDQLNEFIGEFLGRSVGAPADPEDYGEPTFSEEGDFDQYEGEFDEDLLNYVDLVLAEIGSDGETRESSILRQISDWGDLLMTAAAAGETVTKGLAEGKYIDEKYEDERFAMNGDILLSRKSAVVAERDGGSG
jgi:hypothetical protein